MLIDAFGSGVGWLNVTNWRLESKVFCYQCQYRGNDNYRRESRFLLGGMVLVKDMALNEKSIKIE